MEKVEDRNYDLSPYIPKQFKGTDYELFIKLVQEYLNTMYTSLDDDRNISVLQKITNIRNFNDPAQIEKSIVQYYMEQKDFNLDIDLEKITKLVIQKNPKADDEEITQYIRTILEGIPYFNEKKGTVEEVYAFFKLFGFSIKLVDFYAQNGLDKISKSQLYNLSDIPEDEISNYFTTSRMGISVTSEKFSDYAKFKNILNLCGGIIKEILPITKILDMIAVKLKFKMEYGLNSISNESSFTELELNDEYSWRHTYYPPVALNVFSPNFLYRPFDTKTGVMAYDSEFFEKTNLTTSMLLFTKFDEDKHYIKLYFPKNSCFMFVDNLNFYSVQAFCDMNFKANFINFEFTIENPDGSSNKYKPDVDKVKLIDLDDGFFLETSDKNEYIQLKNMFDIIDNYNHSSSREPINYNSYKFEIPPIPRHYYIDIPRIELYIKNTNGICEL